MFMRVAALVFLFLFDYVSDIQNMWGEVIRKRYGQNTVKKLRKLEKRDYRLWKAQIDLGFLVNCGNNFVVPSF